MSWGGGGHCTIFSLQTSEKIAQIAYRAEGRGDLGYAQKKGYFSGDVIPYSPLLLQYNHMSQVLTQIISFFEQHSSQPPEDLISYKQPANELTVIF